MAKMWRCERCNRRYRNQKTWNCTMGSGVIVNVLCDKCQTPEENAEAEINLATLDYPGQDAHGLFRAKPKAGDL